MLHLEKRPVSEFHSLQVFGQQITLHSCMKAGSRSGKVASYCAVLRGSEECGRAGPDRWLSTELRHLVDH